MASAPYRNGNGNGDGWTAKYGSVLQTVLVASIPFTAMWIGGIAPLQNGQEKLNHEKLSIREHDEFHHTIDAFMARTEAELLRLRAINVTKDEMAKFEMNNSSRQEGQANRLLTLENELHGSSNIGKTIDRVQEHLLELDRRLLGIVKDTTAKPGT